MSQKIKLFFLQHLEAIIWFSALVYFAITPLSNNSHFTICPLKLAGINDCPGCGLGHSLVYLLHGHVAESIQLHPLGILALAILISRIIRVILNGAKYRKMTAL